MRFSTSVELKTIVGGKVNGTYSDGFTQSSTNSNGLQASLKFKDSTGQDNKKSQNVIFYVFGSKLPVQLLQ